jgi:Rho termination factor, N-terminal domain
MNYSKMKTNELRAICNERNIKGIAGKKKDELIMTIQQQDATPNNTVEITTLSLFGLTNRNCCGKDQGSEKVANALLPASFGMYSEHHQYQIPLCDNRTVRCIESCFPEGIHFDTEKAHIHPKFINPPPNDVCTTRSGESCYYESKVVMFKDPPSKTELILRQDCYAFNCIQHILINNPTKMYKDTEELLGDSSIVERPYMWMLMWKKTDGMIYFDCVVFTDVSVLRMIKDANTPRSKEALKLVDHSLSEFASKGIMTYKESKSTTVAHQKVSLFPLRDIAALKTYTFEFRVKSTDLILKDIRSDTSLWQEIEKSRLLDTIRAQAEEISRLKMLCGESQ